MQFFFFLNLAVDHQYHIFEIFFTHFLMFSLLTGQLQNICHVIFLTSYHLMMSLSHLAAHKLLM